MSSSQSQGCRPRLGHIRLPKLNFTKVFRIRSASKQKNQNSIINKQNVNKQIPCGENRKMGQMQFSNDKYRSNSLKQTSSKKCFKKKEETNGSSSDQQIIQIGSCRFNSKINKSHAKQVLEKQHQLNMQKLNQIAKLFDPKTIMKMGRKNSECSHDENQKEPKIKNGKGSIRIGQHVFQSKLNKNKKQKQNDMIQLQNQYWKKVNESLILAPCKTVQNEISKDLRQIYQTLVTE